MQWYYIVLIIFMLASAIYALVCLLLSPRFLKDVMTPIVRSYEFSRQFQIEKENWDFNDFDNVWKKHPFSVTTHDGLNLHCMHVENPNNSTPKKVAIICHGHTGNHIQSIKYADIFYKNGFDIILYDNRYFGQSEGMFCTLGQEETKDLETIIDKTKQICGENCYIALHGESMGGGVVLSVLKTRQNDIKFVVADCPFSDTVKLFRQMMRNRLHFPSFPLIDFACALAKAKYGYQPRLFSPKDAVETTTVPICFIHGTKDWLILPKHSEEMYKLCKNPLSELHLFPDGHHARNHMQDKALYTKIITEFIQKIQNSANSNDKIDLEK